MAVPLLPPGIHIIDGRMYSIPGLLSVYLIEGDKLALVDPGPTTSVPAVLEGLKGLGFSPADIRYLIATHLHLDHCGGVGELVKAMPQAQVVIQERGARYLADPSRLIQSIVELLGQAWLARDGSPAPVPSERLLPVSEGTILELGRGYKLRVISASGHAPTEVCYYEEGTGSLFVGDALGIFMGPRFLLPVCPAPSYNLEQGLVAIDRMSALPNQRILFPHFGATIRVKGTVNLARRRLRFFARQVARAYKEKRPDKGLGELKAWADREFAPFRDRSGLYHFLVDDIVSLNVAGLWDFYRQAAER